MCQLGHKVLQSGKKNKIKRNAKEDLAGQNLIRLLLGIMEPLGQQ